ncbi:MAG: acyltransferase [Candidatus Micrarchaeota archaeon]
MVYEPGHVSNKLSGFLSKYGFWQTIEIVLDRLVDALNPFLIINRLNIMRKCKQIGRNVRLSGWNSFRAYNKGEIALGDEVGLDGNCEIWARDNGKIEIGGGTHLEKMVRLNTAYNGTLKIGKNCYFGQLANINAFDKIDIGDNCLISGFVMIIDTDHDTNASENMNEERIRTKPVKIGNNVWLARGVSVLKGVTIGNGAVIGAHSVVTKDIPPNSIAVGVPAQVIKTRE